MPIALSADGLETQTQAEIVDELVSKLRTTFGPNLNVSTSSIMGQLVNIIGEVRAIDQQVLLQVYRCFDPNAAFGVCLDRLASLTGSLREPATNSIVDVEFTFTAAGTVSNGDQFRNDDTGTVWAAVGGPYVAGGAGVISGQLQAVDTGPLIANAGTTWVVVTANPNLGGVANPTDDADLGQNQQSDASFRQSRNIELYARGLGPLAAIDAVVSRVAGVAFVRTYHNPNINPTDADGIPFKAFNVVVQTDPSPPPAALQQRIWNAIWTVAGAGGQAYGTGYVGTITDSEGQLQGGIGFDLVAEVDTYINVELTTSTSEDPITPNIATVVADAILNTALGLVDGVEGWEEVGRDVVSIDVSGVVSRLLGNGTITGVDAVTVAVDSGSMPAIPGPQKLAIGIREIAQFDSPRIQVLEV